MTYNRIEPADQIIDPKFILRGQQANGMQFVSVDDLVIALTHAMDRGQPEGVSPIAVLQKLRTELKSITWRPNP